jgi:DUF1680 family protein
VQKILSIPTLLSLGFAAPLLAQISGAKPPTATVEKPTMMPMPKLKVQNVVAAKAQDFDLADVTLLDGPFKAAMECDATYLLSLNADRLLSLYRESAGLKPKAPRYGGWESWLTATAGHYMSALAMQYRSTEDVRFKERLDYMLDELALIQNTNGNGYVGGVLKGKEIFAEIKAGDGAAIEKGRVPWYALHKLQAGLRDT